jgi:hypothetical protein
MSIEMLYTALSRATSLSNIYIDERYQNIKGLQHEKFINVGEWVPVLYDTKRKALKAFIWAVYDKTTNQEILIGASKHGDDINDALSNDKLKDISNIGVRKLSDLHYDFTDELNEELRKTIINYQNKGCKLMNRKIASYKPLKIGQFKPNKARAVINEVSDDAKRGEDGLKRNRGCISISSDRVSFRYCVNGVRHKKTFKITKKRNLEQAITEAKAFQKQHYE